MPSSKSEAAIRNEKIAVLVSFNISNPPVRNLRVELCIRSPIGSNAMTPRAALGAGSVMINDINDIVILVARLLLATLFLIFGWGNLRDFSGTVSQMVQLGVPTPVLAAGVATFASSGVLGRRRGVHASFGFTFVFIHARNCAYWAIAIGS